MKLNEIVVPVDTLNEFAMNNNTGYSDEVVESILDARADKSGWSKEMTVEELLEEMGLKPH